MPVTDLKSGLFCTTYLQPDQHLQDHIHAYIVLQADFPDYTSREYTLLPQVCTYLLFNLGAVQTLEDIQTGNYLQQHLIILPHHQPIQLRISPGMKILAVQLHAGTGCQLSGIGPQLDAIQEKLLQCDNMQRMLLQLDVMLSAHLQQEKRYARDIAGAVRLIQERGGNIIIRQLEMATFLTKRTLERNFIRQTGLHLKMFCRIIRFSNAIAHMGKEKQLPWARLALDCGYCDQTHFINEFHFFTGCLPGAYTGKRVLFEQAIVI
jgi:AraC-like DNA-binding protein